MKMDPYDLTPKSAAPLMEVGTTYQLEFTLLSPTQAHLHINRKDHKQLDKAEMMEVMRELFAVYVAQLPPRGPL